MTTKTLTSYAARYTFSAKEKDEETGYSYFGARYYNSDLSIWLSVDPMSDKYPNMSPYVYCADNPVILVDPDGRDWYENEAGKMCYTDKYTSEKAFKESGIKGTYRGKTYTKDGQYYSLFGQKINATSKFGKLTRKIDNAFISYANYCASSGDDDYSENPFDVEVHYSVQSETDFSMVIPFVNKFGTIDENQHGPNSNEGFERYAKLAEVYFYVTGARMSGCFQGFSTAKEASRITGGNGNFSTPIGYYLYISNTKGHIENRIVGLRFNNISDVNAFKNEFFRLFPNAK